jgi:hypothetical protein
MPKWIGGLGRNYIYVPDRGHLAKSRVYAERVIMRGSLITIPRPFRDRLAFESYWGESP